MPAIRTACMKASAASVEPLYVGDVAAVARGLSSKANKDDTVDRINNLTTVQIDTIAKALHPRIKSALQVLVSADENVRPEIGFQAPVEAATYVKSVASVIKALLESSKSNVPPALSSVVFELHDNGLISIPGPLTVQDAVAKLLVDYWNMGCPRAGTLVVQLGPYLLWRAIDGKAADVKRLHALREAFVNLDLHHPASQDTVNMILAACITPSFLRCAEGRRTLAYFFEMDSELACRLVKAMQGQICVGKPSMMDAYGEILFKAWQMHSEHSQEHIEACIQQLMQDAILAQSTQLSINMRKVLNYLHEQRRFQGVGRLLHRLYQPILWCHLKAANFQVRLNALGILLDAFPIQGATGNAETEESINMQLTHVMKALRDPNAEVRAAASWGACELLTSWWELLPEQAISRILILMQETAFDADAPKVRMAVIEGLSLLVDNPLAQQSMALLLPNLRLVMFDSNMNVRIRMASLMMRVSQIKTLEWWTIVPVPELLHVMGRDCDAVAKIVQMMLFSQYIDCDADCSFEGCAKLLQLLRDNISAGTTFCRFLASQAMTDEASIVSVQVLDSWCTGLATYLVECQIGDRRYARGAGMRSANGGDSAKRARSQGPSCMPKMGGIESTDDWTGLVAGLKELLVPVQTATQHREGKGTGVTGQSESMLSLKNTLPQDVLVLLFEKAPTVQGAQIVLSIGCEMSSTAAAKTLSQLCLENLKGGYLYLPGINKHGQRSISVHIDSIPRQGRLSGNHQKGCSLICHAVDLALACHPCEFVSLLEDILSCTEAKKTKHVKRRRGQNKQSRQEVLLPALHASGAIALMAMATRDAASQRLFADCLKQGCSMNWLVQVTTENVSELVVPGFTTADTPNFTYDVLLLARSLFVTSALICHTQAQPRTPPYHVIKDHVENVCHSVMDHVEVLVQCVSSPSDIAKMCADFGYTIQSNSPTSSSKMKASQRRRGMASITEAYKSHPQAALLRISCDATHDLAVAANMAVDMAEETSADDESACLPDAMQAIADAAHACKMVWQALQKLLALHVQIFAVQCSQNDALQHFCADVALCSKLSVQAIFRGMGLFHVEGDVASLLSAVGTSLAILNATCGCESKHVCHTAELASASLTGCVYVERDTHAEDGTTALQTPMRSNQEAEEVMGMLIRSSVLVLGHQGLQRGACTTSSFKSWICDTLSVLDSNVADAVRTNVTTQLTKWTEIDEIDPVDRKHEELKMLKRGSQIAIAWFWK
eukprot:jgi/Ulvmu1/5910/UM026_0032.1